MFSLKDIFKPKAALDWLFVAAILVAVLLFGAWFLNDGKETPLKPTDASLASDQKHPASIPAAAEQTSATLAASSSSDAAKPGAFDPDFAAALAAAAQIIDPRLRREALVKACYNEAGHDPAGAVAAAELYSLGQGPGTVLDNLTEQWAEADFHAAYGWVEAKPAGPARDALVARVAFVWSKSQPSEAAQWLVEETEPGPDQQEAIMTVVHQWGEKDMAGASAWVAQFPAGDFRNRAMSELQGIASVQNTH
jgi:hypothetical protein